MFGFVSKKKYDELNRTYKRELKAIKDELNKLNEYKDLAGSRIKGQNIINASHNGMYTESKSKILNLMSTIINLDLCYSNYLVQTQKGDWVVDVTQVPCDYEFIASELKRYLEENESFNKDEQLQVKVHELVGYFTHGEL